MGEFVTHSTTKVKDGVDAGEKPNPVEVPLSQVGNRDAWLLASVAIQAYRLVSAVQVLAQLASEVARGSRDQDSVVGRHEGRFFPGLTQVSRRQGAHAIGARTPRRIDRISLIVCVMIENDWLASYDSVGYLTGHTLRRTR